MPYRLVATEALEALVDDGRLRVTFALERIELRAGDRVLHVGRGEVTATARGATSISRTHRRLFVARNVRRGDLSIWLEARVDGVHAVHRVFGAVPASSPDAHELDAIARRVRAAIARLAPAARAFEVGDGRDRVLVAALGDRLLVYRRHSFRTHVPLATSALADGRLVFAHGTRALSTLSRHALRVELARVPMGLSAPEREALARQLIGIAPAPDGFSVTGTS